MARKYVINELDSRKSFGSVEDNSFKLVKKVMVDDNHVLEIYDDDPDNNPETVNEKLNDALNEAKAASAAKDVFLSNMSHDIRTPMNAIMGMTRIAMQHIDEKGRVSDSLNKIDSASKHLLSLINEVLDMSHIESGKFEIDNSLFELSDLVHQTYVVVSPQAAAKNQNLKFDISDISYELLKGDKERLVQVFVNIINNAVKYTPGEGHIKVSIKEKVEKNMVHLLFECEDDGIGMSEEFQKKLFIPFEREKESVTNKVEGTGLGLSIVGKLIKQMGGKIGVRSVQNEGSTFNVDVALEYVVDNSANEAFRNANVILVYKDNKPEDYFINYLDNHHVKYHEASDPDKILSIITGMNIQNEEIDYLILYDLEANKDFYELAAYLKTVIPSESKIIYLSSADMENIEYRCHKAGIDIVSTLPFFARSFNRVMSSINPEDINSKGNDELLLEGKKIMVVEDNELNAEIALEILEGIGAEVTLCENGKIAFDKYLEDEEGTYDLIMMDIQMPLMNGYEATRAIRSAGRKDSESIPIIAMSSNAFMEDIRKSEDAGMNAHISKPMDIEKLYEVLRKNL
ncbi:MAG: ATP-binding protein [Erysipelotrichaceae bacterium]|nr:ATP-binding protein [Erysipelotrichaceae bacterium]